MPLYLDNAATTKIRDEVLLKMIDSLKSFGNSESKYYSFAEDAKKNIKDARLKISSSVGCEEDEVIFTSGATEANNLIIKGFTEANPERKKIIISSIEHSSILKTAEYLSTKGYEIIKIPVDSNGLVDLKLLESTIDDKTLLVSIIWVNNEIGTIQNMKKIDEICFLKGVMLHSDATQALGKIDINLSQYKALRSITFTSHKIYGPKGIGALILRKDDNNIKIPLVPLFHGGEQENGYRAGTLSNELIVGFGEACRLITEDINKNQEKLLVLENKLKEKLISKFGSKIIINNDFKDRVYGLLNVQIKGFNNMLLLKNISHVLAASTGSACGVSTPSRVLKAIGLDNLSISQSIRLSISQFSEISDFDVIDDL